jgi:hypothetical protein
MSLVCDVHANPKLADMFRMDRLFIFLAFMIDDYYPWGRFVTAFHNQIRTQPKQYTVCVTVNYAYLALNCRIGM